VLLRGRAALLVGLPLRWPRQLLLLRGRLPTVWLLALLLLAPLLRGRLLLLLGRPGLQRRRPQLRLLRRGRPPLRVRRMLLHGRHGQRAGLPRGRMLLRRLVLALRPQSLGRRVRGLRRGLRRRGGVVAARVTGRDKVLLVLLLLLLPLARVRRQLVRPTAVRVLVLRVLLRVLPWRRRALRRARAAGLRPRRRRPAARRAPRLRRRRPGPLAALAGALPRPHAGGVGRSGAELMIWGAVSASSRN
jgi:hypothetical protein